MAKVYWPAYLPIGFSFRAPGEMESIYLMNLLYFKRICLSIINDSFLYIFRAAFYILDCGEQERPHLLQRQAGPAGQAPDGDRGRRAAQEHALGG